MKIEHTLRGFDLVTFEDRYGVKCSLQKSSLAEEDAIWLGCDDSDPKIMASRAMEYGIHTHQTTGWVPFPLPDDVVINTRMHLTCEQVAELLPYLHHFVETGEIVKNAP